MAYQRPTLSQLIQQAQADVLAGAGNLLPIDLLSLLATDQAGLANLHFGHIDRVAVECTPWSAIDTLEAWAALRRVTRIPAAAAWGLATFSGVNTTVIAAGLTVTRTDGVSYMTTTAATVTGGTATVNIAANTAGATGNAPAGTPLTLGTAPYGINAAGVAAAAITGGADAETDAALRTRMLTVYAAPPQGGALADYVEWAQAVPGVTRAWVTTEGMGPGTVVVYPMFDSTESSYGGFPQGANGVAAAETRATPATGDLLAVANAIYPLRPVTALVYAIAPVAWPVAFRITDVLPFTTAMQTAITAALTAVFLRVGAPGGTNWPQVTPGTQNGYLYMSSFTAALDAVPGLQRYTLVTPNTALAAPVGALPTLGAITWL